MKNIPMFEDFINECFHDVDGTPIGVDHLHRPINESVTKIGIPEVDDIMKKLDKNHAAFIIKKDPASITLKIQDVHGGFDYFYFKNDEIRWQSGSWNHGVTPLSKVIDLLNWTLVNCIYANKMPKEGETVKFEGRTFKCTNGKLFATT